MGGIRGGLGITVLNSRSKGLGSKSARVTALCSVLRTVVDEILFLPQEECNVWFCPNRCFVTEIGS